MGKLRKEVRVVGRFDSFGGMVGGESTDAPDRVRMPAEAVRREYGESTEPVWTDFIRSIRSIRET